MKEQFRLTTDAQNTYSRTMPEGQESPIKGGVSPNPELKQKPAIKAPQENLVRQEKIGVLPTEQMDTQSLIERAESLSRFVGMAKAKERESRASQTGEEMGEIFDELRGRGVDINEFSKELRTGGPGTMAAVEETNAINLDGVDDLEMRALGNRNNAHLENTRPDEAIDILRNMWQELSSRDVLPDQRISKEQLLKKINEAIGRARQAQAAEKASLAEERSRDRLQRNDPHLYFTEPVLQAILHDEVERERIFNSLFRSADAAPNQEFSEAFNVLIDQPIYKAFVDWLQENRLAAEASRYIAEYGMRPTLHNANFAVLTGVDAERLSGFVQPFRSEHADLAFSKKGVGAALRFREQALLKIKEKYGGYLLPDAVETEVEPLARKYLKDAVEAGLIEGSTEVRDEQGRIKYEMYDWEYDRAMAFARGLGIITGRTIEIAASSILPETKTGKDAIVGGRFSSLYAQDIIKTISPFRHSIYKFHIGEKRNHVFSYLINRGKKPWTKKELEDWKWAESIDVINGLVDNPTQERFLQVLNPFKVGGIFSRTAWRYSDDPMASSIGKLQKEGKEAWIGTGVWIEKERNNLSHHDAGKRARAEAIITRNLERVANSQPLKLFYNMRDLQKEVLGGRAMDNPQLQDDLDILVVLQEKAMKQSLTDASDVPLDFSSVTDDAQRNRIIELTKAIKEGFMTKENGASKLDKFVDDLRDKEWKMPFVFGTDDVPFEEYDFSKTGPTSLARRWRDIASAKKSSDALHVLVDKLDTFKSSEQLIEPLRAIFDGVAGYDSIIARQVMVNLAEGIMKFYGKDWFNRLPLGLGTISGAISGRASFAQAAFGRGAMAWDELELNEFTRLLRDQGLIELEQQHELQERAGGGKKEVAWGYVRTVAPLIMLALAFYFMSKLTEKK